MGSRECIELKGPSNFSKHTIQILMFKDSNNSNIIEVLRQNYLVKMFSGNDSSFFIYVVINLSLYLMVLKAYVRPATARLIKRVNI